MSTSWSHRSSFRRAGVAVGLAVALIACSANEPRAGESPDAGDIETIDTAATTAPSTTVVEPSSTPDEEPPDIVAEEPSGTTTTVDPAPTDPLLGDVEVSVIRRLPRLELRWTETELDVPDDLRSGFGFVFAGFVGDETVVVGQSSSPDGSPTLSTWRSTDGETWDRADQRLARRGWIHAVFARDDQLVAIGQRHDQNVPELVILGTDASGAWQPIDLGAIDPVGLGSWMHASNGEGVVLVAERYDPGVHEIGPLRIVIWDHELVLDEGAGTYALIDRRSGEVISSGLTPEIYPWSEQGQMVWNLETRELLTVVPWEVWSDAWGHGPPLPIPVPFPVTTPTIEWDGYRIVIDDANARVDVFDLDTGELIQSAESGDFHRGPSPQFRDDTSGELVWSPTWIEWDQLIQQAYERAYENPQDDPSIIAEPQRVLLISSDGIEWTEVEPPFGQTYDNYVDSLWSVAGEYQLGVVEHGMGVPTRRLYRSPDGIEWTFTEVAAEQMMVAAPTAGPSGVVVVSTSPMGYADQTLKTSIDGLTWTPVFGLGEQDDGRHVWFERLASGLGGHGAVVTLVPQDEPEALTITIDGRTARFGDGETAVTITDRDGEVLLAADWQQLDRSYAGDGDPIVTYDGDVTTFWSLDGSVLMEIPDDAVHAEYKRRHAANVERTDRVLFLERDGTWYEVAVPTSGNESVQLMAIGDDTVVVAVGSWGEPMFECCEGEHGLASVRVLVGQVEDGAR